MRRREFLIAAGVSALAPRLACAVAPRRAAHQPLLPWRGADLSFLPELEQSGAVYRVAGVAQDCVAMLAARGCNLVRLRLWVNPSSGWCTLSRTIAMARRAKLLGLKVLVDFHYSDTWADPGHQTTPLAWQGLSLSALAAQARTYTRDVLSAMRAADAWPDAVQLGNEITDGMLWPTGRISTSGWSNVAQLWSSARAGVDDASIGVAPPSVVAHIDRGADLAGATWFFDNVAARGLRYDAVGLSYYPWWHGTLDQCRATVHGVASRYRKPVFLAETAYPWTLGWNDSTNNLVGLSSQLLPGYPATPAGQASFLREMISILSATPYGLGVCWWAPDWVSTPAGSVWENLAWFDFAGNVLPAAAAIATPLT